ncbi:hypothetical protein [Viridibacterium curvum]|uniref:Lipoprotein n=1 Tax=Viridibacterium curvum TaxID=1101404 RepID=A0ABP9QXZ2_9RHOO
MNIRKLLCGLGLAASLSGCGLPWAPENGEPTAIINLRSTGSVLFCMDDKRYLVVAGAGIENRPFPVGRKLNFVVTKTVGSDYNYTYSCSGRFAAEKLEAGKKYYLAYELVQQGCRLELYEQTEDSPVGLRPIKSVPRSDC